MPTMTFVKPQHLSALVWISAGLLCVRVLLLPDAILMHDEYYYAKTAQLWFLDQETQRAITSIPKRGEAGFPNSLFFFVYQWTYAFGGSFYQAAKLLNVLFCGLTAWAVIHVARYYLSPQGAMLVGALWFWWPSTSYLAYFMPEALYESLVWWALAAFVASVGVNLLVGTVIAGTLLGAAMLVKPNSIAVLLAFNLLVLILGWRAPGGARRWGETVRSVVLLNLCFLATGYLLNVGLTGQLQWDPMGKFYKNGLSQIASVGVGRDFLLASVRYLLAYVLVLAFVFGAPLVVLLASMTRAVPLDPKRLALAGFTTLGLGVLLLGSVKVGVNWEQVYLYHIGVYSTRYMSVLFPLLLISFATFRREAEISRRPRSLIGACLAVCALTLAVLFRNMDDTLQMREIYWTQFLHPWLYGASAIVCAAVTFYHGVARRPKAWVYPALLGSVCVLSSLALLRGDPRDTHDISSVYGDAARTVASVVAPQSLDKGYLVAERSVYGSRFMFRFPGIVPLAVSTSGARLD